MEIETVERSTLPSRGGRPSSSEATHSAVGPRAGRRVSLGGADSCGTVIYFAGRLEAAGLRIVGAFVGDGPAGRPPRGRVHSPARVRPAAARVPPLAVDGVCRTRDRRAVRICGGDLLLFVERGAEGCVHGLVFRGNVGGARARRGARVGKGRSGRGDRVRAADILESQARLKQTDAIGWFVCRRCRQGRAFQSMEPRRPSQWEVPGCGGFRAGMRREIDPRGPGRREGGLRA